MSEELPPSGTVVASAVAESTAEPAATTAVVTTTAAVVAAKPSRKGVKLPRWTPEEDAMLRQLMEEDANLPWSQVAAKLGTGRSAVAVEQHYYWLNGTWSSKSKKATALPAAVEVKPTNVETTAGVETAAVAAVGEETAAVAAVVAAGEEMAPPTVAATVSAVVKRSAKRGRVGVKLPRWTSEEDENLRKLVLELGTKSWEQVVSRLGTSRSAGAVEQRYNTLVGNWKRPKADAKAEGALHIQPMD